MVDLSRTSVGTLSIMSYGHYFNRGDHLAIRRPWLYEHHAVYVSDDCVYQLGGGIIDKPGATFGRATLDDFIRPGGTPRRVEMELIAEIKTDGEQSESAARQRFEEALMGFHSVLERLGILPTSSINRFMTPE